MSKEKELFRTIINILGDLGLLQHLLLIGSWAEYVYEVSYFVDFNANLRTRDLDFLIKNLSYPRDKVDLKRVLEENGFDCYIDRLTGVTKFFHEVLELEFLARAMGAGQLEPYSSESLGVKVEGLRHMDLLIEHQIPLVIFGQEVNVPAPHAYVLHKLIIWPNRGVKQEKDIRAVENLLDTIERTPVEQKGLQNTYLTLSPKQARIVDEVCQLNLIRLFPDQY